MSSYEDFPYTHQSNEVTLQDPLLQYSMHADDHLQPSERKYNFLIIVRALHMFTLDIVLYGG